MTRPALYLAVLLSTALLSGVVSYVGVWTAKVAGCRMLDRPGAYLAYCDTPAFGSYEHEAYALRVEPDAVAAMRDAQVLFLGNSRVQFAFSTPQTDEFFQGIGASYHLLGFGYGESSAFPRDLLRRDPPRPKVVVINADPFFQPLYSPAAHEMRGRRQGAWMDAALKKAFGRVQPWLCRTLLACPGTAPSTYRDAATGQWIWHDVLMPRTTAGAAITDIKAVPWREDSLPGWLRDAETFLPLLPVPRSCVVLTGIPTPNADSQGMASAIGRRLGVPVVQVALDGMESPDGNHLTAASAERWSAAFFKAAGPVIKACLAEARPVSGPR